MEKVSFVLQEMGEGWAPPTLQQFVRIDSLFFQFTKEKINKQVNISWTFCNEANKQVIKHEVD